MYRSTKTGLAFDLPHLEKFLDVVEELYLSAQRTKVDPAVIDVGRAAADAITEAYKVSFNLNLNRIFLLK